MGSFSYDWVCVARFGDLLKRNFTPDLEQEKNVFTTGNANATADFVPNGMTPDGGEPDTIKVTVYFEPIGSTKPRELIGTVTTTVNYKKPFNLAMSPGTMTVFPTDSEMAVTAFFKEKLPAGATVAWEWSQRVSARSRRLPPNSNPADSRVPVPVGLVRGLGDDHGARHRRRAGHGHGAFALRDHRPGQPHFQRQEGAEDRHLRSPRRRVRLHRPAGLRRQRVHGLPRDEDAQRRALPGRAERLRLPRLQPHVTWNSVRATAATATSR